MTSPIRSRSYNGARATCLVLAISLTGCTDNAYFLKSDADVSVPVELNALDLSLLADHPLEVAATFKSDNAVQPAGSGALYDSIASSLRNRGIYRIRRYAAPGGDVAATIAALPPPPAEPATATPETADPEAAKTESAPLYAPRLLVLVENHPDLSRGTRTRYFFSGMSLGSWSPNRSTDHYDVTIAYCDPQGQAHVYRSHQDLILSTGSSAFGRDEEGTAGLRRYDNPMAAFGGVIANSINGSGLVTVGKPSSDTAASP